MASLTIEDRLEAIEQAVGKINAAELAEQLARITKMMEAAQDRKPTKEFYGVGEVAEIVGRSPYQIREWCKAGRVAAEKRGTGRGRHCEWMISSAELERYQSRGLLPPNN